SKGFQDLETIHLGRKCQAQICGIIFSYRQIPLGCSPDRPKASPEWLRAKQTALSWEREAPSIKEGSHWSSPLTPSEDETPSAGCSTHRCCQTHDHCYSQAKKLESCKFLIDNPYTNTYSYSCSGSEITCSAKNNKCEDFICNCDREAAICFSKVPYNKEYKNLDTGKFC
uniref:Phospholipase A2 n=1 Tax=Mus spicilegus TaxID=10103 RepID=A0A8C6GXM8_MUSSI